MNAATLPASTDRRLTFLGTTDEVTTCECCGKQGLKCTVAVSLESGDALYFGVTCAARALSCKAVDVRHGAAAADRAKEKLASEAARAAFAAESAPWFAFLAAKGQGADVFTRIQSLGGYAAARAAFKAVA